VPVLAVLALASCAGGAREPRPEAGAGRPTPNASITIAYDGGEGDRGRSRIVCGVRRDRVSGYLRLDQPSDACRRLAEIAALLTAPPPAGRVCAQVYAGPEQARFTGHLGGRGVDRRFARTDACEVRDWERVSAFLPDSR